MTNAAESGACSESDVFSTYVTDGDLQAQVDQEKENAQVFEEAEIESGPVLVGPNWIINAGDDSAVKALQSAIGGKLLR